MEKYKTVNEFLNGLDAARRAQVLELRRYILGIEPTLNEHLKWNAPSYVKDKEDRITFNVMNKDNAVKLVFHMGATRKEDKNAEPILKDAKLIEWASNIRGYMSFNSMEDITSNEESIKQVVHDWLTIG